MDSAYWPNLLWVWLYVFSEKPQTSRTLGDLVSWVLISALLGYIYDLFCTAGSGFYALFSMSAFFLLRILVRRPAHGSSALTFIKAFFVFMLLQAAAWWLRGATHSFTALPSLSPLALIMSSFFSALIHYRFGQRMLHSVSERSEQRTYHLS